MGQVSLRLGFFEEQLDVVIGYIPLHVSEFD
jgi:hypothetical protein